MTSLLGQVSKLKVEFFFIILVISFTSCTQQEELKLIDAAEQGNLDALREQINHTPQLDSQRDYLGRTALMVASAKGELASVKLLLDSGAYRDAVSDKGYSPLMLASFNGHKAVVKTLLEYGADVNLKSQDGVTALVAAAGQGHTTIVELLIDYGADVSVKGPDGVTPLAKAAREGHKNTAMTLLKKTTNVGQDVQKKVTDIYSQAKTGGANLVEKVEKNTPGSTSVPVTPRVRIPAAAFHISGILGDIESKDVLITINKKFNVEIGEEFPFEYQGNVFLVKLVSVSEKAAIFSYKGDQIVVPITHNDAAPAS